MEEIMKRVLTEIERGLKKETHNEANVKCFVTYVQDLPNGRGKFDFFLFFLDCFFEL